MFGMMPFSSHVDSVFDLFDRVFPTPDKPTQLRSFRTDIRNEDQHYLLEAELPGFTKEDISLDVSEGILTIKAERRSDSQERDRDGHYIRRERYYGMVSRSFDVNGIDESNISAAYENGVLTLRLPKVQPVLPERRSIEIQ